MNGRYWVTQTQEKVARINEIDDGLLESGRDHYVAFVVDGAARIITAVVDDRLCDGGEERQYGCS